MEEALFDVTVDGAAVAFTGPHYKRPAPGHSDYLTLAPGETLTRTVALSDFYDLSRTGSYRVSYAGAAARPGGPRSAPTPWTCGWRAAPMSTARPPRLRAAR